MTNTQDQTGKTTSNVRPASPISRRTMIAGGLAMGAIPIFGVGEVFGQSATPEATRVIDTPQGPVEIPANPQRVVSIDNYSMGTFFDIGYEPAGVLELTSTPPLKTHQDGYEAPAKIGMLTDGLDIEAILAIHPDLIVGITAPWAADVYDQLSGIAPTLLFDYTVANTWVVLAGQFADAVGQTAALERVIAEYDDTAAGIATTYADLISSTRWGLPNFGFGGADWRLYLEDSNPGAVLAKAGITLIDAAQGQTGGWLDYSYEQINVLADADVLLTWTSDPEGKPDESVEDLIAQPTWQTLKAVQNGNFHASPFFVPTGYGEATGLLLLVQTILDDFPGGAA